MGTDDFHPDLPAAVAGVIAIVVIVAVLDADVARRWVERNRSAYGRDRRWWKLWYPYLAGYGTLVCGFLALVGALLELWVRTNSFDGVVLFLAFIPICGLLVHFSLRLRGDLGELDELRRLQSSERLDSKAASSSGDDDTGATVR